MSKHPPVFSFWFKAYKLKLILLKPQLKTIGINFKGGVVVNNFPIAHHQNMFSFGFMA